MAAEGSLPVLPFDRHIWFAVRDPENAGFYLVQSEADGVPVIARRLSLAVAVQIADEHMILRKMWFGRTAFIGIAAVIAERNAAQVDNHDGVLYVREQL